MRRLARSVLNVLTALSLLAFVTAATLWAWSYHRPWMATAGYWHYEPYRGAPGYFNAWQVELIDARGRWIVRASRRTCVAGPRRWEPTPGANGKILDAGPADDRTLTEAEAEVRRGLAATGIAGCWYAAKPTVRTAALPHALPAALLAVLPLVGIARAVAGRRRRVAGQCLQCGYDLTANVSGICPECGTKAT